MRLESVLGDAPHAAARVASGASLDGSGLGSAIMSKVVSLPEWRERKRALLAEREMVVVSDPVFDEVRFQAVVDVPVIVSESEDGNVIMLLDMPNELPAGVMMTPGHAESVARDLLRSVHRLKPQNGGA